MPLSLPPSSLPRTGAVRGTARTAGQRQTRTRYCSQLPDAHSGGCALLVLSQWQRVPWLDCAVALPCITPYLTDLADYLSVTDWTSALPFAVDGNTEAVGVGSGRPKSGAQYRARLNEPSHCRDVEWAVVAPARA